jgi:hypothetical protein
VFAAKFALISLATGRSPDRGRPGAHAAFDSALKMDPLAEVRSIFARLFVTALLQATHGKGFKCREGWGRALGGAGFLCGCRLGLASGLVSQTLALTNSLKCGRVFLGRGLRIRRAGERPTGLGCGRIERFGARGAAGQASGCA